MALACPYCHHGVSLKDAKPGKYKPKCPKCEKRFLLTVPAANGGAPTAEPLVENTEATLPQQLEATLPPAEARTNPAAGPASPPNRTTPAIDVTMPGPAATAADQTLPHRAAASTSPGGTGAQATHSPRSGASAPAAPMPESLGGYRLLKELGRGAMGAVYLAKQLSLNRNVAIKLIQAQWASNPSFVARFMREAYAAAQLTHHNVVQIYDLGTEGDTNFFSMEFVNGQSLSELIAKQGALEPRTAVGYILQAARGLQFAHQQGMVHRDVKPANLMVNDHGVVKVADLGLVKAPHLADDLDTESLETSSVGGPMSGSLAAAASNVTLANTAMGTPAFMAPEQAENASAVDHRADIYSLGCSLYVLLVGRPPFEGGTALEVITKHKSKPILWPETMADKIPAGVSTIVMRMVAKKPEERYGNLAEVIVDLERFLRDEGSDTIDQKKKALQALQHSAKEFSEAPTAKLRPLGALGAVGILGLALVLLVFSPQGAIGLATLAAASALVYFVLSGASERTYLFDKARAGVATLRWTDWFTAVGGGLLVLALLALLGWLWGALGGAIAGALLGAGWYFAIDKPLVRRRAASLERAEGVLKELRLRGDDEAAIHRFVLEAGGAPNEEFFEALFGYEAKLSQRAALAGSEAGRRWKKYGAWRDPIMRRLDTRITQARENRDRAKLQRIEEKSLAAKGVSPAEARAQAEVMAQAMVQAMLAQRDQAAQPIAAPVDPRVAAAKKRERLKQMMAEARQSAPQRRWTALLTGPLGFALSGKLRFLVGCLLLVGFALWLRQNGLLSTEQFQQLNPSAAGTILGSSSGQTQPLKWPVVGSLFSSFAPAVAGLILLVTGLCRGVKMSIFAWPAAAIVMFGAAVGLSPLIAAAVGGGVAVVGLVFGRSS